MAKSSISALTMATFAGTSLTTAYQAINAGGFAKSIILIRLINDTNKDLTISYDGITANDFVVAEKTFELYLQTNLTLNSGIAQMKKGTVVYIKSDAAGTGTAYLTGYYQDN